MDSTTPIGGGLLVAGSATAGAYGYRHEMRRAWNGISRTLPELDAVRVQLANPALRGSQLWGTMHASAQRLAQLSRTVEREWPAVRNHGLRGATAIGIGSTAAMIGASHLVDSGALDMASPAMNGVVAGALGLTGAAAIGYGAHQLNIAQRTIQSVQPSILQLEATTDAGPHGLTGITRYIGDVSMGASEVLGQTDRAIRAARTPMLHAGAGAIAGTAAIGLGASHAIDTIFRDELSPRVDHWITGTSLAIGVSAAGYSLLQLRDTRETLRTMETSVRPLLQQAQLHPPGPVWISGYARQLQSKGSQAVDALLAAEAPLQHSVSRSVLAGAIGLTALTVAGSHLLDG